MAVFGVPAIHEDDALRAVRAAVEMREALEVLNKELERDHGVSLAARIGVNTGEVVAGDQRRHARHRRRRERRRPPGAGRGAGDRPHRRGDPPPRPGRRGRRAGPAARGQGQVGAARRVPSGRGDGGGRRVRAAPGLAHGRPGAGARPAPADVRGRDRRPLVSAVHDPRHPGGRQVPAGRGVPRFARRGHGPSRPLPPVRRGDHVLPRGRGREGGGRPGGLRRAGGDRAEDLRGAGDGRSGVLDARAAVRRGRARQLGRGDVLGGPVVPGGGRADGTARRGVRRHPLGRAHVPGPDRTHHGLGAGGADPGALPRAARAAGRAGGLGRGQVQRHDDLARAALRRRVRRPDREPARSRGAPGGGARPDPRRGRGHAVVRRGDALDVDRRWAAGSRRRPVGGDRSAVGPAGAADDPGAAGRAARSAHRRRTGGDPAGGGVRQAVPRGRGGGVAGGGRPGGAADPDEPGPARPDPAGPVDRSRARTRSGSATS